MITRVIVESPLLKSCPRSIVVMCVLLALTVAASQASAAEQKDGALVVTSSCNEELSRTTATKLFEFVERQFDPNRSAEPLEVKVLEQFWDDDRPPSFIHQAKFAAFEATFRLAPGGKRALQSLTTSSASFKLPAGVKLGQSKSQLLHALGPPTAISTNSVLYEIGGEAIHEVFFNFERDRLVRVSWAYGAAD